VLGNETSTNRQWEGVLRMVAIHNRALTPTQIQQNFDAGVGEKYFMLFNVSHLVPNVPQAYVMLEASQLDSYGLQFSKPTFISLDPTVTSIPNVPIEGIRVGVNGLEEHAGQAYAPLKQTIGAGYTTAGLQMSSVGTVMALEQGVLTDLFFLSFDRIGNLAYDRPPIPTATAPAATDLPPESDVGLRTFDEIDTTLSLITGVPQTNTRVRATYTLVKQALPAIEKFGAFGPAQQTALAQLAMQYCNVLVDDNTLRGAFFGGLDGSGSGTAVFGSAGSPNTANRDLLINSLIAKAIGSGVWQYQVSGAAVRDELQNGVTDPGTGYVTPGLINRLVSGPTGTSPTGGRTVMKSACGAVLGSGATLIQ